MADQTTLNNEQVAKVRQVLKLNIYSTDKGTTSTIQGDRFKIESPMTVPYNGVETPVGYISSEGSIYYDLIVEGGKVKVSNVRIVIHKASYRKAPDIGAFAMGNASYRINTPQGDIYNKSYDPLGGAWSDPINRTINIDNVEITSKANEQVQYAMSVYDTWLYNPYEGRITFSLTVPDINILNVPTAPTDGTLVVKYKNDVTGEVLYSSSETVQGNVNHTRTAPEIFKATYKLIGRTTQVRMVPAGDTQEIIFRYNPIYGQIVKYIDKDTGKEIKTQSYTPVTHGDPFKHTPPSIPGYRLVAGQNPINVPKVTGTGNYSFRYEKIPTTTNVTVKHLNKANNKPLRDDVTLSNQTIGSNVNYKPPAITNYAPERTSYTHTVVEGNNVITVYYTENAKIRPWAIRKSNVWKSLNTTRQWMKIRRTANQNFWDTKPNAEIYATDTGKENFSPSRIRKGGKWKAQGKIGD